MKAVVVTKYGGPDNMELQDLSTPSSGPGEVCIRVSRAGINFAPFILALNKVDKLLLYLDTFSTM